MGVRGCERLFVSCSGVFVGYGGRLGDVEEGIEKDHVFTHIIGPFEYLWANVNEKSVGGPTTEDHDSVNRVVHEKECHCGARPYGSSTYLMWVEANNSFSPHGSARFAELVA